MAIGTIFTLFVVPSVYVLVAKDHRREREQKAQPVPVRIDGGVMLPPRAPAEALPTGSA
jgi:hypothetical protein